MTQNATDDSAISAGIGTFSELQNKINSAGQGSTINLDKDYTYNDGFDTSGIQISKALTINGNDYTIDGKGLSRIFDIEASNVNLKGLTLINGYCEDDKGGAILWNGDSGSIVESTLEYNAALAGGAIYWNGTNGEVDHCTFNRNNATEEYGYGGAILIEGECLSITASDFYKNHALDEGDGGALSVDAEGVTVDSCNFERNYANNAGGAIYWSSDDGLLTACTFLHDYATLGGAIVHTGFDSIVSASSFEECYALEGGAISINYCNLRIPDCIFNDNYAEYRGGAIKIDSYGAASVINSIFTNNRVT
jgi:predicted outer membrane repeat protein